MFNKLMQKEKDLLKESKQNQEELLHKDMVNNRVLITQIIEANPIIIKIKK